MTDMKAPERIWAFEDYPGQGAVPRSGYWIEEQSECPEGSPEYVHRDVHDALAKRNDELASEVERLTKLPEDMKHLSGVGVEYERARRAARDREV